MQKKAFTTAVFLLAAVCFLTACNKNGFILNKNQVRECTLTFWNWDTGHEDFYEKIASDYEKENDGVNINIRLVPYETYTEEWLKAASEGETADVFAIPPESLNEFINSRKLEALTYADLIPAGSEGEKTYALPAAGSLPVIFYNKEIYEQNQLVVPETLSDFVTNCAILKQSSCQPFAMSLTEEGVFDSFDFAAGILANGKSLDGGKSEKQDFKKLLAKNTGYHDLLGIAMELSLDKELCVKGHQALLENFAQNKYAMICGTTEDIAWLNNSMSTSYGWFSLPGEDYTNAGVWKANHMFGAAKKGKSVKEAKKFLSYLLNQKNQLAFSSEFGMLPAVRGLKPDDKEIRQAYELISGKKEVYYPFFHAMSQDERTLCAEKLDMIFSGKVADPEGFLSDWIRELKN
ncbi:extracellular solute-binding protein [Clostridium boliviensis]|uniref:Extracellular solute-binding protein n=1 Tax=Clostridium boliviensis TaxID=318465 RepID=A0ABU4GGB1_9CLOT|nr:extracellular solute-binding protein [Clostridium boliviensis]MDW2796664.1 extracellular solute-binding protein [Clostridium boliviensis]